MEISVCFKWQNWLTPDQKKTTFVLKICHVKQELQHFKEGVFGAQQPELQLSNLKKKGSSHLPTRCPPFLQFRLAIFIFLYLSSKLAQLCHSLRHLLKILLTFCTKVWFWSDNFPFFAEHAPPLWITVYTLSTVGSCKKWCSRRWLSHSGVKEIPSVSFQ